MIISHRHKFVYIKTRKTASTSIEIALSKFCGPDDVITPIVETDEKVRRGLGYRGPQNFALPTGSGQDFMLANHMPAVVARQLLGPVWSDYVSFTLERNPFDRVISQYYWELPNWGRRGVDPPSLTEFIATNPPESLSNWSLYADGDTVIVDAVGRYESMDEDLRAISERIGLPEPLEVSRIRTKDGWRKDHRPYREVISEEGRRMIEAICHHEIEEFGYHW